MCSLSDTSGSVGARGGQPPWATRPDYSPSSYVKGEVKTLRARHPEAEKNLDATDDEARFLSQSQRRLDRAVPACWNCVLGDQERIQVVGSHADLGDVGLDK